MSISKTVFYLQKHVFFLSTYVRTKVRMYTRIAAHRNFACRKRIQARGPRFCSIHAHRVPMGYEFSPESLVSATVSEPSPPAAGIFIRGPTFFRICALLLTDIPVQMQTLMGRKPDAFLESALLPICFTRRIETCLTGALPHQLRASWEKKKKT
jgi:hypothetical protein